MALSLYDIKNILNPKRFDIPMDDFRMINSWAEYDETSKKSIDEKPLKYLCYEIEVINPEAGTKEHLFKAIKFARVIRLPKSAKQNKSLMDMHTQILSGTWEMGSNMITIIANIIEPVPMGLLYLYGVQGVARNLADAKMKADSDFVGLVSMLSGTYRVLELRILNAQETEWLREKMYGMEYMTVVRGIPKASKAGEDAGNKGMGGANVNPDSQGTLEEIISGMADYEYVIEVLSTPVYMDTLKAWALRTEKDMTDWNEQLQGTKSLSFNLSIPMMNMASVSNSQGYSRGYTETNSESYSVGESFSTSYGQSVGSSLSESFGESFGQSLGQSVTDTVSQSHSISQGVSIGESFGTSIGESFGVSVGESFGTSVGESFGTSVGQSFGTSIGQSFGNSIGESHGSSIGESLGSSIGKSFGQSTGESFGTSVGESFGTSIGESFGQSIGKSFGTSVGESFGQSTGQSIGQSTGESFGTSVGESYGQSVGESYGTSTGESFGTSVGQSQGISRGESYGESSSLNVSQGIGKNSSVTESSSVNHSQSQSVNESIGYSSGSSYSVNQGQNSSSSHSQGISNSVSYGGSESVSTSNSESFGQSQNQSQSVSSSHSQGRTDGVSTGVNTGWNKSTSENHGTSEGNSWGANGGASFLGGSIGGNSGSSDSYGSSNGTSGGTSRNESHSFSDSYSTSAGSSVSSGSSYSQSQSQSHSQGSSWSNSSGTSESYSESFGTSLSESWGASESVSKSQSVGSSVSNGWGSSVGKSEGVSESYSIGQGLSQSASQSFSESQSQSMSNSHSQSLSNSMSQSASQSQSQSMSNSHSQSLSNSMSQSASQSQSQSMSNSMSQSTSDSTSQSTSQSHSQSTSDSHSQSMSNSESQSMSNSYGQSSSSSYGQSMSESASQSMSESASQSFTNSHTQSTTQSHTQSTTQSYTQSATQSHTQSMTQSQTESLGSSVGKSVGQSSSQSHTKSSSQSVGQTYGESEGVSSGKSTSTGKSEGVSTSLGTTGSASSGFSGSMGISPSIGYSKSYQWKDQQVQDILELLEFQNERIKRALRGNGAFYTYVYVACATMDGLSAAMALAKSTWQNEYAMTNPLQVLNLREEEQKHLLYHFAAFSSDVSRENVAGVSEYKYATVLLPNEFVAYTHLPRISEGGIFSEVNDIPKFSVPSMMKGEIFMGKVLSAERYTMQNGYMTPFDYRISEKELMHGFFTGASRSGKTVCAMRFVAELSRIRRRKTGKRLRIVAMDPKHDWRMLARFVEPERFRFYSLGNAHFRPINLNPCKIPKGVWPQFWIDGLIDIYCRAYGLLERGKQMLGETFYQLYEEAGVFAACDRADWKERVPDLSSKVTFARVYERMNEIKVSLEDPTNKKGKAGNDTRDAYARLLDRLQCFSREFSIERKLFSNTNGLGVDELIGEDDITVFESEGLESTFANFIFGIITSGFYKVAKSIENGYLNEDQYETVLVIEEANKVLTGNDCAGTGGGASFGMTGQSEFEEMLDQAAGYGLFILSITQKIADMPSSIIANAGLVFAGRLARPDDVATVIRSVAREERYEDRDILKWFPRAPIGWFICKSARGFDFKDAEPVLIKVSQLNMSAISNLELEEILTQRDALNLTV